MCVDHEETKGPLRVLLIEDSEEDAELVVRALERGGFEVEHRRVDTARDLERTLDAQEWDIALSDYAMPAFDGMRAFRIVQDKEIDLPFIIVSGTVGEDVAVEAMKQGAHDYLLKGNLARLPAAVERELREAANRREANKARAALRTEERRYRSIFNSASVSLWEVDFSGIIPWLETRGISDAHELRRVLATEPKLLATAATHATILDVNDTTVALFGADAKDRLLGTVDRILPMGLHDAWRQTLEGIADRKALMQTETTANTMDGRQVHVLVSIQLPKRDEDLKNVVVATCDVTDRWQMESQMRAAQRMEAVGRLAGGVAHDFNNVLTVIQSYAAFLRDQFHAEDPAREDIETIEDAAERAARLTSQLLAFSRRQVQKLQVISLNDTVEDIDKMLRRLIGEDIDVSTELGGNLGLVRADPSQIEQIVMNLAVNARDAMPGGGSLTIETENVELDQVYGAAKNVAVPPGNYVMLAVSDTGSGMDEETRQHVFEPFFTTKDKSKGTGLGLSTVYGIVKQSKGYIWVYSEVGKGTTFKVYLPQVETATQAAPRRRVVPSILGGSETILLVEDEDLVRKAARRIMERHGYTVLEGRHGGDALLIAERHKGPIHLLVTDVVMPEIGGRQLVNRLAPLRPTMKVVYMSGYTDNAIVHHGVLDEDAVYVQKPFSPESLLCTIREVLDA